MPSITVTPEAAFQVARKTITAAQVLQLASTPQTLIAAPGSGRAIVLARAVYNYTAGTTAYTDGGGALSLLAGTLTWCDVTTAGFWDQAASQVVAPTLPASTTVKPVSVLDNTAVTVQAGANPTLGDGTLTVTAWYTIIAVA